MLDALGDTPKEKGATVRRLYLDGAAQEAARQEKEAKKQRDRDASKTRGRTHQRDDRRAEVRQRRREAREPDDELEESEEIGEEDDDGSGVWGHFFPNFGVVLSLNYFVIYSCLCIAYAIHKHAFSSIKREYIRNLLCIDVFLMRFLCGFMHTPNNLMYAYVHICINA